MSSVEKDGNRFSSSSLTLDSSSVLSSSSVKCLANHIVETTLDSALNYIHSNVVPDLIELFAVPLELIDGFSSSSSSSSSNNNSWFETIAAVETKEESTSNNPDNSNSENRPEEEGGAVIMSNSRRGSVVADPPLPIVVVVENDSSHHHSNLKSAFVPTPRKRQPAKDGRKRSVQFAPEFIKDEDGSRGNPDNNNTSLSSTDVVVEEQTTQDQTATTIVNKNHSESDTKQEPLSDITIVESDDEEITRL